MNEHTPSRRSNPEREQTATERQYSIEIRPPENENGVIEIHAGYTPEYQTDYYVAPPKSRPHEYTEEMLANLDENERAEIEVKDYLDKMAKIMENAQALEKQGAFLTEALEKGQPLPRELYDSLDKVVQDASSTTSAASYNALPDETKRFVEYADRLVQLCHLVIGSTYSTRMGALYTDDASQKCVDDFCAATEEAFNKTLAAEEENYTLHIERFADVQFINRASNLILAIIDKIRQQSNIDVLAVTTKIIKDIVPSFVREYSQHSSHIKDQNIPLN